MDFSVFYELFKKLIQNPCKQVKTEGSADLMKVYPGINLNVLFTASNFNGLYTI